MRSRRALSLLLGGSLLLCEEAAAHDATVWEAAGRLIEVAVDVEGRTSPLYLAPDGSGRYYLEAREGSRYEVRLASRTHERVGVALTVDGLNAISGEREPSLRAWRRPGRMYILDPWDVTVVRGWRTSLDEVRRFTFVDERVSYAARSQKANAKMGWIEIAVYRERRAYVRRPWRLEGRLDDPDAEDRAGEARKAPAPAPTPPDAAAEPPAARPREEPGRSFGDRDVLAPRAEGHIAPRHPAESFPGTGWGPRASDPAVLVHFDPEPTPAETLTLRYEYASALRALGILPRPWLGRDRLRERDRGGEGFARPPAW